MTTQSASQVTFATVQQARDRIKNKTSDVKDDVIVAMWDAVIAATTKQHDLTKQLDTAAFEMANYARSNDMLASKLAKLQGQAMPLVPVVH